MSDLYTSLVRLKQSMNDGCLPPMTPVPAASLDIIDPAFTIGFGGLEEDDVRGLRCPVRGCGKYFHRLGTHITRCHREIGCVGVKEKLSIPQSAPLVSRTEHGYARARAVASLYVMRLGREAAKLRPTHAHKSAVSRSKNAATVGIKNLRDACPAQLSHKIIDLHNKIGRTPTLREANAEYGQGFSTAVIGVYGRWNSAVAQCGLAASRKSFKYDVNDVLEALRAYHALRGTLPNMSVARRRQTVPLLPSIGAMKNAFGISSYPEIMRRAAAMLNIYGGRYGLPEIARGAA